MAQARITAAGPACRQCVGTLRATGHVCGDRPDLEVFRCASCGVIQLAEIVYTKDGRYAADDYFPADWRADWDREAAWNEQRVERCRTLLPTPEARVALDFGCGIGGFLRRARPHFAAVIGFDLSSAVVRRHRAEGFEAVDDLDAVDRTVDTLALFHVLEHVPEPWHLLADLMGRFPKVDRVVVETPNTDEILIRAFDLPAYRRVHYNAEHIWYFTPETLTVVLERAGLRVLHRGFLQRYTLGNTLGWIANGRGGGQNDWPVFNRPGFHTAYEAALEQVGLADSVFLIGTPVGRPG